MVLPDLDQARGAVRRRGAADGVLSGLARGLDPLTRAHRIQERAALRPLDRVKGPRRRIGPAARQQRVHEMLIHLQPIAQIRCAKAFGLK